MQPRPPRGSAAWMAWVEQMLTQHHVDMDRLWKVTPQTPDPEAGVAAASGLNPAEWTKYTSNIPGSGTRYSGIKESGTPPN